MQVCYEELNDVSRYIKNNCHLTLQDHQPKFEDYLRRVSRFRSIDSNGEILEIGIGTGWFPILCRAKGLSCKGLDISSQLVDFARTFGRKYGIEPDVEVANIETYDAGRERYDVIIAASVFEHVQNWTDSLKKVYDALKPGGVLFFESTNKFSFTSGEFAFPLYGWLPDQWRYRLRIRRQGPEIMNLGIDFHQFTYPLLRRTFRRLGFKQIVDRILLADVNIISSPWRRFLVRVAKRFRLVREIVLLFAGTTTFVCVK
jgi:SAM-dependent methyltransferase